MWGRSNQWRRKPHLKRNEKDGESGGEEKKKMNRG